MKRPSAPTRMRDPAVTPVLVLKMSISNASPAPAGSTCPVSSAQSGSAAVMLPQFTLQSIAALSAASCAKVLTMRRRFPSASSRAKNTLLPVGTIRPRPVICLLPARVPSSGRPIRWRSSSSRRACARRRPVFARSPARSMCRRAHGAPGTRCTRRATEVADRGKLSAWVDPDCSEGSATAPPRRSPFRSLSRTAIGGPMLAMSRPDPITEELFRNAIAALGDEMVLTIYRTAYSGVLKNIMDYSAALCDAQGRLAAQGLALPGHLCSIPVALQAVLRHFGDDIAEGDILINNDPYDGGMHLPDIFIFKPLFAQAARRQADRLCRDDLPPHRCRRPRARIQRVGQHRDLCRRSAHSAAEALRARPSRTPRCSA